MGAFMSESLNHSYTIHKKKKSRPKQLTMALFTLGLKMRFGRSDHNRFQR